MWPISQHSKNKNEKIKYQPKSFNQNKDQFPRQPSFQKFKTNFISSSEQRGQDEHILCHSILFFNCDMAKLTTQQEKKWKIKNQRNSFNEKFFPYISQPYLKTYKTNWISSPEQEVEMHTTGAFCLNLHKLTTEALKLWFQPEERNE